ncbi:MAG TPA: hypothetical protein VFR81_08980 [Longimicrobium sp.]|nr:hypothetical protein [Longimicrobium sp.]
MNAEIEAAIEELYAAFRRPTPGRVEGCPCCTTEAELRALVGTPLRGLTAKHLWRYAFSVMLTVGGPHDLRYFWPRLMELAARDEPPADLEVILAKPRLAGWRDWPEREQTAMERFIAAIIGDWAVTEHDPFVVDSWICGFGRLVEELPPRLAPLLRDTPAAAANLAGLHSVNLPEIAEGRPSNAFWSDHPRAAAEFAAWLGGDEVAAALARSADAGS